MTEQQLDQLRFPIGKFTKPESLSREQISECIVTIAEFPVKIRRETEDLPDDVLDTRYRPEGWTVRQVVHHCADSHMNAIIRFKNTLTEDAPTIKPYFEDRWAELADTKTLPIESSLRILEGVHHRMTVLFREMKPEDFKRYYVHPEYGTTYRLDQALAMYAWHCEHHLAHIRLGIKGVRN
jgi:hypothetical protein